MPGGKGMAGGGRSELCNGTCVPLRTRGDRNGVGPSPEGPLEGSGWSRKEEGPLPQQDGPSEAQGQA